MRSPNTSTLTRTVAQSLELFSHCLGRKRARWGMTYLSIDAVPESVQDGKECNRGDSESSGTIAWNKG